MASVINVVVSGAAGRIAYSLVPHLLNGSVFGPNVRVSLRLLDIDPGASIITGFKLEIEDCCYDLLYDVIATTSPDMAFRNADVAILIGGFPRLPGMERRDLIARNSMGMQDQASSIERCASRDCKVLVVANPANTNCLVAMRSAPSIPKRNFSCLTRLDHERLRGMSAQTINALLRLQGPAKIGPSAVLNICVFGNHSSSQVPYVDAGSVLVDGERRELSSLLQPSYSVIKGKVQNRGSEIMQHSKASSGMSAARAISLHLKDWLGPAEEASSMFSMGILSNGNPYGVPDELVCSFPCRRSSDDPQAIEIVPDLPMSESVASMLEASVQELMAERGEAADALGVPLI